MTRRAPLLLALLLSALTAAATFRVVDIRTDLTAFLPTGRTEASRFMLDQLQTGAVASLILVGLEGAPPLDLARISTALADGLDRSGEFSLVSNGRRMLDGPDAAALFAHRYLLSPATATAAFTAEALHADLVRLFAALQSSASPIAVQFGLPDPTSAFAALAPAWAGQTTLRSIGGVWFAADRDRALLVLQTRAAATDIGGQDRADAAIHAAFQAAQPGPVRLLLAGPAVFTRAAAAAIRADVQLLTVVSGALLLGLLLWRFRSLAVLAAIAIPMLLSTAAAALATQLVFGFVHGIALGFGMTMLGVTLDYPVLLIGHRKADEPARGTLHRIGRAFALAVASAALGLTGMVFSGFPGLAQLGLFAATGVLTAALVTGVLLPPLIVAANLAPVWAGDPGRLLAIERWRDDRAWAAVPAMLAATYLLVTGGPRWETDVAKLSPVPAAALALDAELRHELGVPDEGSALITRGSTAEDVLEQQEALLPRIDALVTSGAITGYQAAARLLPSAATQRLRQAALPDAPALAERLTFAAVGLPFRADAFADFTNAVAAARAEIPVTLTTLDTPVAAARLRPLLFQRDGTWFGPVAFTGVSSPGLVKALASDGALFVDTRGETNRLVSGGAVRAGAWLAGGVAAAGLAMLAGLRNPAMVGRIALAIGSAVVVTIATLSAAGVRLSLIHLVALQLAIGVGLDYALFYARRQLDAEERARTVRTLVTCNAMTLLTFGLLAFCRTPLLQALGETVAIGAVSAMCFAFLLVGERPRPHAV